MGADEESGNLIVSRTYGDRIPEYSPFQIQDFVSQEHEEVEFPHTMADILNAIMQAGFVMKGWSNALVIRPVSSYRIWAGMQTSCPMTST